LNARWIKTVRTPSTKAGVAVLRQSMVISPLPAAMVRWG
jgi:hypothetical protein